jgi:hypothetical protein
MQDIYLVKMIYTYTLFGLILTSLQLFCMQIRYSPDATPFWDTDNIVQTTPCGFPKRVPI